MAVEKGLGLITVTNHETVAGLPVFLQAAEKASIAALTGLASESRCDWVETGCEIHLLAYGFPLESEELGHLMETQRRKRDERNGEILDLLAAKGYPIHIAERESDVVNRMHIAMALIAAGHAVDVRDAFARFLGPGGLARLDMEKLAAEGFIDLVHRLGGLVFWAHPLLMRGDWLLALDALCKLGLDGVEVYYPAHRADGMAKLRAVALEKGLMISTGSDFHGANRAHVEYGVLAELADLDPEIRKTAEHLASLAHGAS